MVKRRVLIKMIADQAARTGVGWRSLRDRGDHELWVCGGVRVPIPRHREINEITALEIMKRLEEVLGQRWWR